MKKTALGAIQERCPKVSHIVDATENVRFSINKGQCDKAVRGDFEKCVISLGVKHNLHPDKVLTTRSICYLIFGEKAVRYIVPAKLREEILAFDRGGFFAHGTYELKKPWAGNKLPPKKHGPTKVKGLRGSKTTLRDVAEGGMGLRPRLLA